MSAFDQVAFPALLGAGVSLAASVLIVATRRWHGGLSLDSLSGPQKVQRQVVPRIGGVAVFAGFWAATIAAPATIRDDLAIVGACGLLAFAAGLAEDLTKKVSGTMRLFATLVSGIAFCVVTGHAVARVEIGFVDHYALAYPWIAIPFTAFAMAGVAHSVNIIDGFNGLSAGGVIIMLAAFGVVALHAGDSELASLIVVIGAALAGFLLINFPRGPVIMGDGGAYLIGFLLAAVAVMLPERNPDVSPWIVLVVLGYPVSETLYSILRKTLRKGDGPGRADKAHLHHLIYRYLRRVLRGTCAARYANPAVGALLWGAMVASLIFVSAAPHTRSWALPALAAQAALYLLAYRVAVVSLRTPLGRAR
jgi:UDP-N-acetylmuramyl pentapeptide phosphotransferase/UDP-N-acetylglucosamine-1-phosphate transferase